MFNLKNNFKLYYRQNVSNQYVEGLKWIQVDSQSNGVVSCSCSKTGGLILISYDGKNTHLFNNLFKIANNKLIIILIGEIKLRLNISRDNPIGTSWAVIAQPLIESNIRQTVLGSYTFWALDNQGNLYFRSGVRQEHPQGKLCGCLLGL